MRLAKDGLPSEHAEQVAFIQWFRYAYPRIKIIAIPNGACTNPVAGRRFKEEGRESGVPDLYIPEWDVWVEMKRVNWKEPKNPKEGTTAFNQKIWQAYLRGQCEATVFVCRGFEDARMHIVDFVKKYQQQKMEQENVNFNEKSR